MSYRGLCHCRIVGSPLRDEEFIVEWDQHGYVVGITSSSASPRDFFDCANSMLIPMLVDQHVHGYRKFAPHDNASIKSFFGQLWQSGVSAACLSTVAMTSGLLRDRLRLVEDNRVHDERIGCHLIGAHIEGLFIDPAFAGAHNPAHFRDFTPSEVSKLLQDVPANAICQVTVSPEGDDAPAAISCLADAGILVSLGHTGASLDTALNAVEAGAACVTHTYNAMRSLTSREPGLLGLAVASDVTFEVIPNPTLVHPANLAMLLKLAGTDRVVCVSDCVPSSAGNDAPEVVRLAAHCDDGRLAGGAVLLPELLRYLFEPLNGSASDLIKVTSQNSRRLLGLPPTWPVELGEVLNGVLIDGDWRVRQVVCSAPTPGRVLA